MAYRFEPKANITQETQRIAREQIEKAKREIRDRSLDSHTTVHQARKRCKKVRALLRAVRPTAGDFYQTENRRFRDAARRLSRVRDAEACVECFEKIMDFFKEALEAKSFKPVEEYLLKQRRKTANRGKDLDEKLEQFESFLSDSEKRLKRWNLEKDGFNALRGGLMKTYRRARKRFADAYDLRTDEAFHELRKRVKYHRYHLRLLRGVWFPIINRFRKSASDLSGLLGNDRDLAILRSALDEAPAENLGMNEESLLALFGLIAKRRQMIQKEAHDLCSRLYAETPGDYVTRLEAYWHACIS